MTGKAGWLKSAEQITQEIPMWADSKDTVLPECHQWGKVKSGIARYTCMWLCLKGDPPWWRLA